MTQKTAIVLDNMGTMGQTPDEERDEIVADLSHEGLEPEVVHYGHDPLALPETQIDLLVVDYGALWQTDMGDWTRGLLRWADEHPSSLVLLWSSMTADMFVTELKEQMPTHERDELTDSAWTPPWPNNLRAVQAGLKWYAKWGDGDSIDWLDASYRTIRSWFGLTEPPSRAETLVSPDGRS